MRWNNADPKRPYKFFQDLLAYKIAPWRQPCLLFLLLILAMQLGNFLNIRHNNGFLVLDGYECHPSQLTHSYCFGNMDFLDLYTNPVQPATLLHHVQGDEYQSADGVIHVYDNSQNWVYQLREFATPIQFIIAVIASDLFDLIAWLLLLWIMVVSIKFVIKRMPNIF